MKFCFLRVRLVKSKFLPTMCQITYELSQYLLSILNFILQQDHTECSKQHPSIPYHYQLLQVEKVLTRSLVIKSRIILFNRCQSFVIVTFDNRYGVSDSFENRATLLGCLSNIFPSTPLSFSVCNIVILLGHQAICKISLNLNISKIQVQQQ